MSPQTVVDCAHNPRLMEIRKCIDLNEIRLFNDQCQRHLARDTHWDIHSVWSGRTESVSVRYLEVVFSTITVGGDRGQTCAPRGGGCGEC